jgi:hypothetical protein
MKVLVPGHRYELDQIDGTTRVVMHRELQFVAREPESERVWPGVQTQEVLRVLIDRTQYCDSCLPWAGNDQIVHHLRMALVLHEARALIRKVEEEMLLPELLPTGQDGHFVLVELPPVKASSYAEKRDRDHRTDTGGARRRKKTNKR